MCVGSWVQFSILAMTQHTLHEVERARNGLEKIYMRTELFVCGGVGMYDTFLTCPFLSFSVLL